MSRFKRENQLDMEQILVAYCPDGSTDQPFAKAVPLVNSTTALGIADGQLGVLSYDYRGTVPFGTFLSGGETPDDVRFIKILQGTPASSNITTADAWEVGHKGYVETGIIGRDNVRSVTVQKCRPKCLANVGVVDLPDPCDNTEYRFFVSIDSVRNQVQYGYNGDRAHTSFETPCYTALGTVDPKDHLLQNLLFDFNKNSNKVGLANGSRANGNKPVVAFAINSAGGAGVPIGTIACGDLIPVQKDSSTSCEDPCNDAVTTSTVVADLPMIKSLGCLLAKQADALSCGAVTTSITATSTIECIDLSTAGAAANVDSFVIVGLEHELSLGVDRLPQTLTSINLNLQAGFRIENTSNKTCCRPDEGVGHGRNWVIQNEKRWQRHIHNMYVNADRGSVYQSEGQSYISSNKRYTSIIIDYYDHEETLTVQEQSPKQAILLTCCNYDCTTPASVQANITTNMTVKDTVPFVEANLVDLVPTVEVACCPTCDPIADATNLEADIAGVLLTWLKAADVSFNNGIEFDDFYYNGGPSNLFTLAGI